MDTSDAVTPQGGRRGGGPVVLRAVPGTAAEWTSAAGRISGLLLALAETEAAGHELPAPLHARRTLRAWARLKTPVLAAVRVPGRPPVAVLVRACDVDTLGAAGRLLGRALCRERVHGAGGALGRALLRDAREQGTSPERLVAQLARVHGVLDAEPWPGDPAHDPALALWRAGA